MAQFLRSNRAGSALPLALITTSTLIALGAVTLMFLQNRYRQVHQTAAWQEALLSAEAGIDIAVNELRKNLYDPTHAWQGGWVHKALDANGVPIDGSSTAMDDHLGSDDGTIYYSSEVLLHQGEGGQRSRAKITAEAPGFLLTTRGDQWYRIRSTGIAEVPGGVVAAGDKRDLNLRRFDLKADHRRWDAYVPVASPQATRLIEAIIKPVGVFRLALFSMRQMNLTDQNVVVDSYDSRDPNKSTNGWYDPAKRQNNGDVATNGTLIAAGSAHIYGDASTNGGTILSSSNITGEIRNDFYQEVFAVTRPVVTPAPSPITISGTDSIQAQTGTPSQYTINSINLSGNQTLTIKGVAGSQTFAQIVVTGNMKTAGNASIILEPGVNVRIFAAGDVDMSGNGFDNPNNPLSLQLYGIDRPKNPDGSPITPGDLKIAGNGGFTGTVYAPSYNVSIVGGGTSDTVYGSFAGWSVTMNGVQAVHYDEALGDGGLISDYKVVSWFEDAR
jgi:hypothetical protein